jgi:uncharacterized protein YjbJ (UPF0337 family)
MDKNQVEGVVREGVGRLQDGAGGLLGDNETQLKGKANEAAGAVQGAYGKLKDKTGDLVDQAQSKAQDIYGAAEQFARQQPLAAIGVGVGLGFGLGLLVGLLVSEQSRPTTIWRR